MPYGELGNVWTGHYPWVYQADIGWMYAYPADAEESSYWLSLANGDWAYYGENGGEWAYTNAIGSFRYWKWEQIAARLNHQAIPVEDVDTLVEFGNAYIERVDTSVANKMIFTVVMGGCGPVVLFAEKRTTLHSDSSGGYVRMKLADLNTWGFCTTDIKVYDVPFWLGSMADYWSNIRRRATLGDLVIPFTTQESRPVEIAD